jgi:hypothetical protein
MKEKIESIIWDEINFFVMLRDLDEQYQQALSEAINRAAERLILEISPFN